MSPTSMSVAKAIGIPMWDPLFHVNMLGLLLRECSVVRAQSSGFSSEHLYWLANCLLLWLQGIPHLLLASVSTWIHVLHTHPSKQKHRYIN